MEPADSAPAAIIEPRIADAGLELSQGGLDGVFGIVVARTTLVYGFTLYETGEPVATWTVTALVRHRGACS